MCLYPLTFFLDMVGEKAWRAFRSGVPRVVSPTFGGQGVGVRFRAIYTPLVPFRLC